MSPPNSHLRGIDEQMEDRFLHQSKMLRIKCSGIYSLEVLSCLSTQNLTLSPKINPF